MKNFTLTVAFALLSIFIFPDKTIAQWYNSYGVTNINELTEAQCKLALEKATKISGAGTAMTLIGGAVAIIGGIMYSSGLSDMLGGNYSQLGSNYSKAMAGAVALYCGGGVAGIGIPLWIVGAMRKMDIEIALAKFSTTVTLLPKISQGNGWPSVGFCLAVTF